tara:strand:- start:114401 stop:114547 length:147 start_codon:yes stop_codon:yes gene_type:complete
MFDFVSLPSVAAANDVGDLKKSYLPWCETAAVSLRCRLCAVVPGEKFS